MGHGDGHIQGKIRYLPGDIPKTTAQECGLAYIDSTFSPTPWGDYPNGDGRVQGVTSAGVTSVWYPADAFDFVEPRLFFPQLSSAKLLSNAQIRLSDQLVDSLGPPGAYPLLAGTEMVGVVPVTPGDSTNVWFFIGFTGVRGLFNNSSSSKAALVPWQARYLDNKLDNGVPSSGGVVAVRYSAGVWGLDTTANACVRSAAATEYYDLASDRQCRVRVMTSQQ